MVGDFQGHNIISPNSKYLYSCIYDSIDRWDLSASNILNSKQLARDAYQDSVASFLPMNLGPVDQSEISLLVLVNRDFKGCLLNFE